MHGEKPLALKDDKLLEWTFEGYKDANVAVAELPSTVVCLTPPSIVAMLACGYEPVWHESAVDGSN